MNGVTSASDSAGSNQRGAIVMPWTRVICPAGASARAAETASAVVATAMRPSSTRRNRDRVIVTEPPVELVRRQLGEQTAEARQAIGAVERAQHRPHRRLIRRHHGLLELPL